MLHEYREAKYYRLPPMEIWRRPSIFKRIMHKVSPLCGMDFIIMGLILFVIYETFKYLRLV